MPIPRINNPSKTVGTSRAPQSQGVLTMPQRPNRPPQKSPPITNWRPPVTGGDLPPFFGGNTVGRGNEGRLPPGTNPIPHYPQFPGGERPGTFYVPPGFTLGPNNRPGGGIGNGLPGRGNEGVIPPTSGVPGNEWTNPISGPQVPPKNPWIPPRSRPGRWAEGMDLGPPSNSPGKGNNGAGNKPVIDGGPYAGMTRGEAMRLAAKSTAKAMGRNPGSFPGMMPFIQAMRRPKAGNPPPTNDRPIVNPPTTQDPMPVYNPNTGAFGPPTQNMNSLYGPMDTSGYSNWLGSLQGTPSYNNMNDIQRYLDPRYRGGV